MKHFVFLAVLLLIGLGACQKEDMSPVDNQNMTVADNQSSQEMDSLSNMGNPKAAMTEYAVNPKFGKPNSTNYFFKVYDPSGTLTLAVKLYDKATGTTTYFPMTKVGSYWTLSKTISNNGWYDYRYVYNSTHANISTISTYTLCNSKNNFTTCPYAISWPFGADGSSWYNRNTWNGGQEGGVGYGWNEGTHIGISECYSDDWNKTNDLGAIIRSPLDGYIETIGQYYVSGYGYSKFVSIIQQSSDGKLYRFYVSHLQSTSSSLYSGKYVRAGIDQIGTLGMSGASSPHAHTNMRVNGSSVAFYFNAQ